MSSKRVWFSLLSFGTEILAFEKYTCRHDELFFKATHDAMTGLANRALFMDRLRNAIGQSSRDGRLSGLLIIDLDGFKQINDTYGHRIGDAVLVEFADRLKSLVRATDTAARLGGDEFAVILTPLDDLEAALRRLGEGLKPPFVVENTPYPLKASIGYAAIPEDGTEPEVVMEVADRRMYSVKKSGNKTGQ